MPPRSPLTTLTRWKLSCALLAALAGVATVRAYDGSSDRNTPAKVATAQRGSGRLPIVLKRPVHVSAAALGVSQKELVDRILSARSVRDVALLAEKLGMIG